MLTFTFHQTHYMWFRTLNLLVCDTILDSVLWKLQADTSAVHVLTVQVHISG